MRWVPLIVLLGCSAAPRAAEAPAASATGFDARRAAHPTAIHPRGPAPGEWRASEPPEGVQAVRYRSDELELVAWFATPAGPGPRPALIYFHGDFSFAPSDFERVRPFLDAGMAVMTPTLRGENGNPGDFELLFGELDDARAAVRWLAARPEVDPARIYAFGHSVGGAVSALLSLDADLPLRATGSSGGIYVPETFVRWSKLEHQRHLVRFDPSDPEELALRVLGPHVAEMARPHLAYVGTEDRWFIPNATTVAENARRLDRPFELVMVDGNHASALAPSLRRWQRWVEEDLARPLSSPAAPP